ncbi:Carbonic anhydrase [Penicillium diatomitis]|uniref:Carbonic anhydrase n=1 Tax=Penicillium diatomitis TaxID=2819901 RepID=A0A9W9X2M6_9EURO|nr:Carbonic anhydrase [Penicillium diatomitis]KAJ5482732.1 Carbonic anhydrase [Penicillium diatomitis]
MNPGGLAMQFRCFARASQAVHPIAGLPRLAPVRHSLNTTFSRVSSFSTSAPAYCANSQSPPSASETNNKSSLDSTDKYVAGLRHNKNWAAQTAREHPDLFPTLANGQQPQILWLGCSDSRCAETSMLGLLPGDVFVHRNIANILHPGDLSSGAVIEFAVKHLKVKHVVVCGHTSCGGVAAAMGSKQLGILDPWLLPLRQVRERNLATLESLPVDQAAEKLVELNVRESLNIVTQKSVVLEAIQERGLQVHGLIYDVASGVLRELDTTDSDEVIKKRLVAFKLEE